MNVAIIGGGASAHLLSVLLAGRGHRVRIKTSRPEKWSKTLKLEVDGEVLVGVVDTISSDIKVVMNGADVAFLCMPVHQYPVALQDMIPGNIMNPHCIVGAVYGQGGFDWMVSDVCRRNGIPVYRHFAIGLLPWIARIKVYGESAISYGPKLCNGIACSDKSVFSYLQEKILDDLSMSYWGQGRFEYVPNFLTLTLTVDNQIIHPSRCFALAHENPRWKSKDDIPYFYRDFDDFSANILKGVDEDYTKIRRAYFKRFPQLDNRYNLNYLDLEHWSYGSHNPNIQASFVESNTLREIRPPVVQTIEGEWCLDVNHRFFKDDFAFGLEIAQWFGHRLGCDLGHVDRLVNWYKKHIAPQQDMVLQPATPTFYGCEDLCFREEVS